MNYAVTLFNKSARSYTNALRVLYYDVSDLINPSSAQYAHFLEDLLFANFVDRRWNVNVEEDKVNEDEFYKLLTARGQRR